MFSTVYVMVNKAQQISELTVSNMFRFEADMNIVHYLLPGESGLCSMSKTQPLELIITAKVIQIKI